MGDEREQTAMERKDRASALGPDEQEDEDDEDVSSPFDHPAFLPVLLLAMALWFGYDGWFSETIESVRFNRYGFFFLIGATLYFVLADFTRLRFLLPLLFVAYGVWLGLFDRLGAPDAWWRDDEGARLFNRYGALACFAIAAVAALRELLRGRPERESAPE